MYPEALIFGNCFRNLHWKDSCKKDRMFASYKCVCFVAQAKGVMNKSCMSCALRRHVWIRDMKGGANNSSTTFRPGKYTWKAKITPFLNQIQKREYLSQSNINFLFDWLKCSVVYSQASEYVSIGFATFDGIINKKKPSVDQNEIDHNRIYLNRAVARR